MLRGIDVVCAIDELISVVLHSPVQQFDPLLLIETFHQKILLLYQSLAQTLPSVMKSLYI